jgi:hypothetical protein
MVRGGDGGINRVIILRKNADVKDSVVWRQRLGGEKRFYTGITRLK